jgi:hypothetical protein
MTFAKLPNSYVQGAKGSTMVAQQDGIIALQNGQFFVGAGDSPLKFQAAGIKMTLPSRALALVTTKKNKQTQIVFLDGGKASSAYVNVAYQKNLIAMQPADQLFVNPTSASGATSAIHRLGATKTQIKGGPGNGPDTNYYRFGAPLGYTTHKSKANMGTMLERYMLLNCRTLRLVEAWPYKKLDERYGLALRQQAVASLQNNNTVTLTPVMYTQHNLPNTWTSSHAVLKDTNDGHYNLSSGSILVHVKSPVIVDTPHGSVMLKEGCVALISSQPTMTRVFNLEDRHMGSVEVIVEDKSLPLNQGSEAALMDRGTDDISRVILSDNIGHKNMQVINVDESHGIVTGQFSMGDMISYHPLLIRLRSSSDKKDRDLVQYLIKTAAARQTMDSGM